ncbi:MAG: alanine racemase [Epsilonproteobacteria bacterium]|nr:alanine racemase [Campylobacterota bacterium]
MSKIIISKENYHHNLGLLVKKAGSKDKIMVVIKDNAYGHGLEIMAKLAKDYGIKKAAVKTLQEALLVENLFDEVLILANHPPAEVVDSNISFAVHSLEFLQKFPKNSKIHLNIDTGMHRNGILMSQVQEALEYIEQNSLILKGVFTHFRSADDMNGELFWQQENWKKAKQEAKQKIEELNLNMPAFHSCNSAALLRSKDEIKDDFARCGIATYGYTHIDKNIDTFDLKPVLSLYASRLSSRVLKSQEKVGYGGVYEAKKDMIISTYDIGYGDGFFRYDGLGDLKIANGQKILGRVSMDSLCIKGDKQSICLFNDASELSLYFKTITYEILTKLMPWITREVV